MYLLGGFFIGNGMPYCRKCITFRGQEATDDYRICDKADYKLEYQLTKEQQIMSDQPVDNFHMVLILWSMLFVADQKLEKHNIKRN